MGYYADLIKQKQEKKNFRDPLGLGLTFHELGTPDDYKAKFKKGDKVKLRYGSGFKGEGVIVEGPIKMRASLTPTYRIKLTDGKVVGRYEEELAKNSKDNEKEEKDNASVQDRFRHKGCMITILKKGENQYTFSIEQNGREEGTNATYPTQDKAESEAKREVEANWNEKEEGYYAKLAKEKKNSNAYLIALSLLKGNTPVRECVRELTDNYHFSKDEAYKALDKAAKDLHDADIEEMVRKYYK